MNVSLRLKVSLVEGGQATSSHVVFIFENALAYSRRRTFFRQSGLLRINYCCRVSTELLRVAWNVYVFRTGQKLWVCRAIGLSVGQIALSRALKAQKALFEELVYKTKASPSA